MLGEENYTLDIRPTFIDELDAAVRYIERTFRNYQAADDLVAKAYAAIDERLFAPESFVTASRMCASHTIASPWATLRYSISSTAM